MNLTWSDLRWSVPFYYLFVTRLKVRQDRVSWLVVHPAPVLYLAFLAFPTETPWVLVSVTILGLLAFQSLYEIGYVQNDIFTVKRELKPTLRLLGSESSDLERLLPVIVATRAALFVAFVGLAALLMPLAHIGGFFIVCALVMLAFVLHNALRSRWNVLTYLVLAAGRYASVPLLVHGLDVGVLLAALAMMPVPRTLEHACKPKYGFDRLRDLVVPFVRFRPVYYLFAFVLWIGITRASGLSITPGLVLAYFLLYRAIIYLVVRRGVVTPTRHAGYESDSKKVD